MKTFIQLLLFQSAFACLTTPDMDLPELPTTLETTTLEEIDQVISSTPVSTAKTSIKPTGMHQN